MCAVFIIYELKLNMKWANFYIACVILIAAQYQGLDGFPFVDRGEKNLAAVSISASSLEVLYVCVYKARHTYTRATS